ncbi:HEAT repeat domain-containing protein [Rhodopirellula bahusiensis]|uniref:HEAT repeat domain-containing protein n=1 Tax=Rhodopirellula bahusiensis TaxID=2014065 RepID=UPI003265F63B
MWPFRNKSLQTIRCKIPRQDIAVGTSTSCNCLDPQADDRPWTELKLHLEEQDTNSPGWLKLLELVEEAVSDQRAEFAPARDMTPSEWAQIVTLPPSIARLKAVEHLSLYGSGLVRIPPEIGEMESLKQFTPYTSYRLHWFPYEILRCKNLRESTVSTRALYGNCKYHPPFPALPSLSDYVVPSTCSVCNARFGLSGPLQYWVSLPVATDVLPLLVHACSPECVESLRVAPEGYVAGPHRGGLVLDEFVHFGAGAVPAIIPILRGEANPQAVAPLIEAVKQGRELAAAAIIKLGPIAREALPHLTRLEGEDATRALASLRNPVAIPELLRRLNESDYWCRVAAAEGLGLFSDPAIVEALLEVVANEDESLFRSAAECLLGMGPEAIKGLTKILRINLARSAPEGADTHAVNDAIHVRASAAEFLGKIGHHESVPLLVPRLTETWTVFNSVADALFAVNTSEAIEALKPELRSRINSDDRLDRTTSVRLMGAIGDNEFVLPLTKALGDPDSLVRNTAKAALQSIGTPQASTKLSDE